MSALRIRPHSLGTKAREAIAPRPLRLIRDFTPFGAKSKLRLAQGEKVFRAAGDLVILGILEHATLNGAQIRKEFAWVTGEHVPMSAMYPKLKRLREQGRVRDTAAGVGGSVVKGIFLPAGSRPVTITPKGKAVLDTYRRAMDTRPT